MVSCPHFFSLASGLPLVVAVSFLHFLVSHSALRRDVGAATSRLCLVVCVRRTGAILLN